MLRSSLSASVGMWVLALVLLAAPAAAGQVQEFLDKITSLCADRWPDDYSFQESCYDRELEASRKLMSLMAPYPHDAEEQTILLRCLDRWTDGNERHDFTMMLACTRRQIKAYQRLYPKPGD